MKILFISWCLIIFVLSIIPGLEAPINDLTFSDKIAHFIQYLIFGILYVLMRDRQNKPRSKILQELIILSLILPILNELIQIPVPNRKFSLLDIAANYLGFVVVIVYIKHSQKKKTMVENEE